MVSQGRDRSNACVGYDKAVGIRFAGWVVSQSPARQCIRERLVSTVTNTRIVTPLDSGLCSVDQSSSDVGQAVLFWRYQ